MTCLPDVNVWLALAIAEHVHHAPAKHWFKTPGFKTPGFETPGFETPEHDQIAFCRITQMGFLRLLTNPRVMSDAALTPERAWNVMDGFFRDTRIFFSGEPPGLEMLFRESTRKRERGANFWTDAYLSAFATAAGFTLVTFDTGYARHKGIRLRLLGSK